MDQSTPASTERLMAAMERMEERLRSVEADNRRLTAAQVRVQIEQAKMASELNDSFDSVAPKADQIAGDAMLRGDCLRPWMFVASGGTAVTLQSAMPNRVFWHGHWVWTLESGFTVAIPTGTYDATPWYIHVRCTWADKTSAGITLEGDATILGTDQTYYRHLLTAAYLDTNGNAQFATESPCWMGGHIHIATAYGPPV